MDVWLLSTYVRPGTVTPTITAHYKLTFPNALSKSNTEKFACEEKRKEVLRSNMTFSIVFSNILNLSSFIADENAHKQKINYL
jgi:hypothetical protein